MLGADRQRLGGEPLGLLRTDPARQRVRPVLGAVQAHQPVVRVEHRRVAAPHLVGGERRHQPAGRRVPGQGRDGDLVRGGQDGLDEVVHRVDVLPGLQRREVRALDDVELDPVGVEVPGRAEHQHRGRPVGSLLVGGEQPAALLGAQRPARVGEFEVADLALLAVAQLRPGVAPGGRLRAHRHLADPVQLVGEHRRGRQLEGDRPAGGAARAKLRDPHRAVHGGPADRAVPGGQHGAGHRAAQPVLGVAAVQEELPPVQLVEHAGLGVGGAQLAQHGGGVVLLPVDPAGLLAQEGPQFAAHVGPAVVQRLRGEQPALVALDGQQDGLQGGVGDLTAVQLALAAGGHGEVDGRPDVAGVHLLDGLQHGHAPPLRPLGDRPVERGGAAVALGAGVHDQDGPGGPDVPRHGLGEHRADDQFGIGAFHRRPHLFVAERELDGDLVAALPQLGVDALGQAVERTGDQENAQGGPPAVQGSRGGDETRAWTRNDYGPCLGALPSRTPHTCGHAVARASRYLPSLFPELGWRRAGRRASRRPAPHHLRPHHPDPAGPRGATSGTPGGPARWCARGRRRPPPRRPAGPSAPRRPAP